MVNVRAWIMETERRQAAMRPSTIYYERFDQHARTLTVAAIRACADLRAMRELERRLREGSRGWSGRANLHGLSRVFSKAEIGVLVVEATNRVRQLAAGDPRREKGPRLDPRLLPDDRLDALIQRHRDLAVVEALRDERARRARMAVAA